uniref:hypothetical protein n=1 Tax=Variovorax sp. GV025 TaxID=3450240 RepID=UPI000D4941AC
MQTTISLLDRALEQASASEWARKIGVHRNAFTNARAAGHLTPVLAGHLAIELHEDAAQWMATAVLEGEKSSPAKDKLVRRLSTMRTW